MGRFEPSPPHDAGKDWRRIHRSSSIILWPWVIPERVGRRGGIPRQEGLFENTDAVTLYRVVAGPLDPRPGRGRRQEPSFPGSGAGRRRRRLDPSVATEGQHRPLERVGDLVRPLPMELPIVQRLYDHYSDRNFVVLAVNVDANRQSIPAFLKRFNISLPIYYAAPEDAGQMTSMGIPTTFLIGPDRMLLEKPQVGYEPSVEDRWKLLIERKLVERKDEAAQGALSDGRPGTRTEVRSSLRSGRHDQERRDRTRYLDLSRPVRLRLDPDLHCRRQELAESFVRPFDGDRRPRNGAREAENFQIFDPVLHAVEIQVAEYDDAALPGVLVKDREARRGDLAPGVPGVPRRFPGRGRSFRPRGPPADRSRRRKKAARRVACRAPRSPPRLGSGTRTSDRESGADDGKRVGELVREKARVAESPRQSLAGRAMKVRSRDRRLFRLDSGREVGADHSGEDVPGARGRHERRPRRVDCQVAGGGRDQRSKRPSRAPPRGPDGRFAPRRRADSARPPGW